MNFSRSFGERSFADHEGNAGGSMAVDSYAVYRELHSPEHVFADAFLLFEKIMDLGIKDMFYVGESPPPAETVDDMSSMTASERQRWRR